jgi:uncharacterized BrkB/YihY/UPF0761 family membrane protein
MSKNLLVIVTLTLVLLAFACFIMLFFVVIPEENVKTVDTGMGIIIGACIVSVSAYFFGSSSGSKAKTDQISTMIENNTSKPA